MIDLLIQRNSLDENHLLTMEWGSLHERHETL